MMDKLIKSYEQQGKIARQQAGMVQVEALLRESIVDLEEAKKTMAIADRATYLMAYNAMLKAGRALLLMEGIRPVDGGQHKTVVEITGAILGEEFSDLVNHFEVMRRKRNEMTYEAGALLSSADAKGAFADSVSLVRKILAEARRRNPQSELIFD